VPIAQTLAWLWLCLLLEGVLAARDATLGAGDARVRGVLLTALRGVLVTALGVGPAAGCGLRLGVTSALAAGTAPWLWSLCSDRRRLLLAPPAAAAATVGVLPALEAGVARPLVVPPRLVLMLSGGLWSRSSRETMAAAGSTVQSTTRMPPRA
jgi:hypothetical protein